jgi:hypothetical protein
MRHTWTLILLLAAGCGRYGFDDRGASGGGGGDDGVMTLGGLDNPGAQSGVDAMTVTDPAQPSVGLVAYWDFDDITGSGATSSVAGDLAACAGGECPTSVDGVKGMAAQFDGTTSCMHVPSMANWSSSTLTMSAWVKIPTAMLSDTLPVLTRDLDGCPSPGIQAESAQVGFMFMGLDAVHHHAWTPGLGGDEWHQLGVRWDGTTESVFIDGVCACGAQPGEGILFDGASYEFQIGCDTFTPSYTNGVIDELRIYDRALSDQEMAVLAAVGGRPTPTPQACAATCEITTAGP